MRDVVPAVMVGLGIMVAAAAGAAATAPDASGTTPKNATPSVYAPVTSDLMIDVIQPRHIKLWLAGKSRNWAYADYERHNIGGALRRMAAAIPTYKGTANADLIAAFATPHLADLDAAIKAKSEASFVTAYRALTTGCNGCHQATGHEMVVIQVPDSDSFPDQDFRPHKP
jgi:hypothetical protein